MSTIGTLLTYDRYSKPAQASIGPPKGLVIFKLGGGGGGAWNVFWKSRVIFEKVQKAKPPIFMPPGSKFKIQILNHDKLQSVCVRVIPFQSV